MGRGRTWSRMAWGAGQACFCCSQELPPPAWPSSEPSMAARPDGYMPASQQRVLPLCPPWAAVAQVSGFLLSFIMRHQRGHTEVNTACPWEGCGGLG